MVRAAESSGIHSTVDAPRFHYVLDASSAPFAEDPGSIATLHHLGMRVAIPSVRLTPLDGVGLPVEPPDRRWERPSGHFLLLGVDQEYAQLARISLQGLVRSLTRHADADPDSRLAIQAAWWAGNGHSLAGATRVPNAPTFVTFDINAGEVYAGTSAGGVGILPIQYHRLMS